MTTELKHNYRVDRGDFLGLDLSYYDTGNEGHPIVFVHGNSGSSEVFVHQFDDLDITEHYRCIAVDLPGHGSSGKFNNPGDYNIKNLSLVIAEFINSFSFPSVLLAGHSLGGHIVLEAAPNVENLGGAVCWGTTPIKLPTEFDKMFIPDEAINVMFSEEYTEGMLDAVMNSFSLKGEAAKVVKSCFKQTDPKVRSSLAANIQNTNTYCDEVQLIENATYPIGILFGSEEKALSRDYIESLSLKGIWREKIQFVPKLGHYCQMENAKIFNGMLLEFFDDCLKILSL